MIQGMNPPAVVFVLSTNYAGSHLLAQLLAAHSRCAGVGELHNYRKFRGRGSRSGNVVDEYREHPVFQGLEALPEAQWHARIMARLRAERPGLTHLVDNSKRPDWMRRCSAGRAYPVYLLRDPRALVSRWLKTFDSPMALAQQRRRVLRRRPWAAGAYGDAIDLYLEKWLLGNRAISRFLRRRGTGRPVPLVTYRDLTRSTATVLAELMPALGLYYEPRQLDYGARQQVAGTRKRDYLRATRQSMIRIDLRWREHLSRRQLERIERHAGVQRFLRAQRIVMTDEGLSRLLAPQPGTAARQQRGASHQDQADSGQKKARAIARAFSDEA